MCALLAEVRDLVATAARPGVPADRLAVELNALLAATVTSTVAPPDPAAADDRPGVEVTVELHQVANEVRDILAAVPGVYSRGNVLVQQAGGALVPIPP